MKPPLALLVALALPGAIARADSPVWNQFRGPNGSGIVPAAHPPTQLDPSTLAWKAPIPPGLSSPVLSQNHVFLTGIDGDRLVTLAFDRATGQLAWRQEAPKVPIEHVHKANSPAASTPLVDDQRLYVYFGSFGLLCYNHAGVEQWRKPIPTPQTTYGMSTSPIALGDNLILVLDTDASLPGSKLSQSRVLCLKRATGEVVWETPRPFQRSGMSTPSIWSYEGGQDLVILGGGRVCGYDPQTGAEKWFATGFSRETIAVPVSGNGLVYTSAAMLGGMPDAHPDPEPFWKAMLAFDANGDGRIERSEVSQYFTYPLRPELPISHPGFGLPLPENPAARKQRQAGIFASMDKNRDGILTREEFLSSMSFRRGKPMLIAIRPGGHGDVTTTHVAWELNRSIPEIPSPVFYKDRLYMVRDGGLLAVADAATGKVLYNHRLGAAGPYSSSPVIAADHVYLASNRGVVTVVKTGDTFQMVHQQDLKEPVFATPALDDTTLYIRTDTHLLAYRARP